MTCEYKYQFGSCGESYERRVDAYLLGDSLTRAVGSGLKAGLSLGFKYGWWWAVFVILRQIIKEFWRQRKDK